MVMTLYKVAIRFGRWKYGFSTIQEAIAYESARRRRTGVFAAIVAYKKRGG
jgi:hypothetical protein